MQDPVCAMKIYGGVNGDFLTVTAVAVQWNGRVSTYVYYDGHLGPDNYDSHNVSGGLRVSF